MKASASWAERLERERADFLAKCDLCGICHDVCPVYERLGLGKNPANLQSDILDILAGGRASEEAYHKVWSCSLCARCLRACPQALNPFVIQAVLRERLAAVGQRPVGRGAPLPPIGRQLDDILCSLQIHQEEVRWLPTVPANPKQADVVLFLGCTVRREPHKIFASLDVLAKLGLDVVAVAGGELCCGNRTWHSGRLAEASQEFAQLIRGLTALGPKKVLCWCATCDWLLRDEASKFADLPFEVQFLGGFLSENLPRFDIKQPIEKTVTIHDSCNLGRKAGDYTSIRALLGAIPGLRIVEMPHSKEDGLCCGAGAWTSYPNIARELIRERQAEAKASGADLVVSSCTGCHHYFTRHAADYVFESENYIILFAEALGLHYEDKLTRYMKYHDVDRVLAEAKQYVTESPLSEEEIRAAVSAFLR